MSFSFCDSRGRVRRLSGLCLGLWLVGVFLSWGPAIAVPEERHRVAVDIGCDNAQRIASIVSPEDLALLASEPASSLVFWVDLAGVADPLPVMVGTASVPGNLALRLHVPARAEPMLRPAVRAATVVPFVTWRADGSEFYRRGWCRRGQLMLPAGPALSFRHVPFTVAGRPNPAFLADLGYLEIEVPAAVMPGALDEIMTAAFAGRAQGVTGPLAGSRFGVPHRRWVTEPPLPAFILPPIHKLSANKHLLDPQQKLAADLDDLAALLAPRACLLSQSERVRRRLVPPHVRLNWARIDDTDLGSGQNPFVFVTVGPGINYFDGPWGRPDVAMPGPRVIIDPVVAWLVDAQIYPSYSIDPVEKGEGRLATINRFQTDEPATFTREIVPMPRARRLRVLAALAEGLCRYGLLNDDPRLDPGFVCMGQRFRGNVVNNEIRLQYGLSLRDLAIGVIVPPGTAASVSARLARVGFIPAANEAGFIVEAPTATDAGFRQAYLELVLRRTHPSLHRIASQLRRGAEKRRGYEVALAAIDRLIRREGMAFLMTPRARQAWHTWSWSRPAHGSEDCP